MLHDEIDALLGHAACRLLRANTAPLVLGFLGRVFVDENFRSLPRADLLGRLDDELHVLAAEYGPDRYPRSPAQYLDEWALPERGWLRKYYPVGVDEPHYDVTPAVERAYAFVASLRGRAFVGTESRLNTAFDLLRQLVFGAEQDLDVRVEELRRRRAELDREIEASTAGDVDVMSEPAQRERYQQFTATAVDLLSDFREVEANFRALDRNLRERITAWSGSKGELLADVVGSRSSIGESDEGHSFSAFYDFLLSADRQEEFARLLAQVHALPAIGEVNDRMRRVHHDWLDAGERTQATVRLLSEQLRRFLDDQVWLENRRVMDVLRGIERRALALRDSSAVAAMRVEIDGVSAQLGLPMERPLYRPPPASVLDSSVEPALEEDIGTDRLFDQVYVDPLRLGQDVRDLLATRPQVGIGEILRAHPLTQGLAELVTYLSLTDPYFEVVFDGGRREPVAWTDDAGLEHVVTMPGTTFVRSLRTLGEAR